MERFGIIANGWKPLTIITKRSILDVAAALDPPLIRYDLENEVSRYLLLIKLCALINMLEIHSIIQL